MLKIIRKHSMRETTSMREVGKQLTSRGVRSVVLISDLPILLMNNFQRCYLHNSNNRSMTTAIAIAILRPLLSLTTTKKKISVACRVDGRVYRTRPRSNLERSDIGAVPFVLP